MKLHHRRWTRGAFVVGLLVSGALWATLLAASDPALARSVAATPQPPMPLTPPLQTPEAGALAGGAPAGAPEVQAVPFRPAFRITLGDLPPGADQAGAVKPDGPAAPQAGPIPGPVYAAPDYAQQLVGAQNWTVVFSDTFDDFYFPTTYYGPWISQDNSDDGFDRQWKDVQLGPGAWSAWPAAGGADAVTPTLGYPDNLNSWMIRGPLDFSNRTDVYVGFSLWYDTEPNYDWMYLCLSVDGYYYDCNNYWSGSSGDWTIQTFYLTSYAGYSSVYIAWVFYSDSSVSGYAGPYVDNIYIWDYAPAPTPTPDPNGQSLANGGFENGLNNWSVSLADDPGLGNGGVTTDTRAYIDGAHSAQMWRDNSGGDWLYQPFTFPASATSVTINYWYGLGTTERTPGNDLFCASLRRSSDALILVDLGCVDATDSDAYWHEVTVALSAAELAAAQAAANVQMVFELYNTRASPDVFDGTYAWVDQVQVYATGAGGGAQLDSNEPNDGPAEATPLACDASNDAGVIGDALGAADVDWFRLDNVPVGTLALDINARSRIPASELDSVLTLYAADGATLLAFNDDDGVSYDSYLTHTVSAPNSTFYVSVASYSGYGAPDYTYQLTSDCNATAAAPEGSNTVAPAADTWTVMLYLNAEDPDFEATLRGYRTAIESYIGSKSSFLTVTILYDGPQVSAFGDSGATRYVVQPNGAYTTDTRWSLGELNMGDPETLRAFVNWSMDLYPAENYYLAIDDHGNGVYGISWDRTNSNDPLLPQEVYSALKDATANGDPQRRIDLLDYEACLMGLAENAYDLRQWADYVIFSQQISWGITTYPVYFNDLSAGDTPLQVGQRIVQRYSAGATAANFPHTISLVDTGQMPAVRTAVNNFANALIANIASSGSLAGVQQARSATQAFAASLYQATNPAFAEYLDLADLALQAGNRGLVSPAIAAAVQTAVDQAVIAERHVSGGVRVGDVTAVWNHARSSGLSIYYPPDKGSQAYADYTAPILYQLSHDGTWDEFLQVGVSAQTVGGGERGGMSSSRSQDRLLGGQTFITVPLYLPLISR